MIGCRDIYCRVSVPSSSLVRDILSFLLFYKTPIGRMHDIILAIDPIESHQAFSLSLTSTQKLTQKQFVVDWIGILSASCVNIHQAATRRILSSHRRVRGSDDASNAEHEDPASYTNSKVGFSPLHPV